MVKSPRPALLVISLAAAVAACGRANLEDGAIDGPGGSGADGSGADGSGADGAGANGTGANGTGANGSGGTGTGASGTGGTGAVGTGGGGQEPCPHFGTECSECISETCVGAWCSCYESPDCLGIFDCWSNCADQSCVLGCNAAFEGGISDALLVSNCAGSACSGVCDWGDDLEPCGECIFSSCSDAANACFSEPDCFLLFDCLTSCPPLNVVCQDGCYADFGGGAPTLQDLLDCSQSRCDPVCN